MLANTLNTNEIKNAAGTEVEFHRISTSERSTTFAQITEQPSYPHRLNISHQEIGTGLTRRRRTRIGFEKTTAGMIDSNVTVKTQVYLVADSPVGNQSSNAVLTDVIAELLSFCASTGATTTILYDGTGNGAQVAITGGL